MQYLDFVNHDRRCLAGLDILGVRLQSNVVRTGRVALTDAQWQRLQPVLPTKRTGPKSKDREFIDAVLYRAKTAVAWRDLPERFGRRRLDRNLYRQRYLVEVFFHHLKRFRAIATRYDKTARV